MGTAYMLTFRDVEGATYETWSASPWTPESIHEVMHGFEWGATPDDDSVEFFEEPLCAVWYAAIGCLPDGDGPEFVGPLSRCQAWVQGVWADPETDYPVVGGESDTDGNLYTLTIEDWDGQPDDDV